jgi:hypothetical protein
MTIKVKTYEDLSHKPVMEIAELKQNLKPNQTIEFKDGEIYLVEVI